MSKPCRHCGATRDIHQYETGRCPVGGVEQSRDNYLTTTYEEVDETPQRVVFLTERVNVLEKRVADLTTQFKGVPALARRMKQLEGWQSDLAVRLVNVDRKLQKKPPVRVKPVAKKRRKS